MSRSKAFRPACLPCNRLEERIALSGASGAAGPSVLLRSFRAPMRTVRPARPSVSSLVELAYDSFQEDYRQVRATYLNSVQAGTATAGDRDAFVGYTGQRAELLAQEVTNSLLVYPKSATRGNRADSSLPLIVGRINGAGSTSTRQGGSLKADLIGAIPAADASATTIAINTIAQDNAIEASRVAALNGVTIVRNGYFGASRKR